MATADADSGQKKKRGFFGWVKRILFWLIAFTIVTVVLSLIFGKTDDKASVSGASVSESKPDAKSQAEAKSAEPAAPSAPNRENPQEVVAAAVKKLPLGPDFQSYELDAKDDDYTVTIKYSRDATKEEVYGNSEALVQRIVDELMARGIDPTNEDHWRHINVFGYMTGFTSPTGKPEIAEIAFASFDPYGDKIDCKYMQ